MMLTLTFLLPSVSSTPSIAVPVEEEEEEEAGSVGKRSPSWLALARLVGGRWFGSDPG